MSSSDTSSKSTSDKLVYMAYQIGSFFITQDQATASAMVADHIRKFWDARLRSMIIVQHAERCIAVGC
jgi:formate dehydrogenase subunit delta